MVDISTVTGGIGAITGVIALIVSMKSYARVNAIKALDLRLELNKAFDNLEVALHGIDRDLDYAHQSHVRVMAATGRGGSGEMVAFEADFEQDKVRLRTLLDAQPRRVQNYERSTPTELELMISSVHSFHAQVSELWTKYRRLFEGDEGRRKEIRDTPQFAAQAS